MTTTQVVSQASRYLKTKYTYIGKLDAVIELKEYFGEAITISEACQAHAVAYNI